jgi:hypothetical protein
VQCDAEITERPLKSLTKNMQSNGQPFKSPERINPFHGTGVRICCLTGWVVLGYMYTSFDISQPNIENLTQKWL